MYAKALSAFARGTEMARDPVQRVEIGFGDSDAGRLVDAGRHAGGPAPAVVYCNGLDSTKELLWFSWLPTALRKRGISSLCIDQPGTGEALRLR